MLGFGAPLEAHRAEELEFGYVSTSPFSNSIASSSWEDISPAWPCIGIPGEVIWHATKSLRPRYPTQIDL
jgi:hypothetical protein